jgi:hypothetical protein
MGITKEFDANYRLSAWPALAIMTKLQKFANQILGI